MGRRYIPVYVKRYHWVPARKHPQVYVKGVESETSWEGRAFAFSMTFKWRCIRGVL